MSILIGLFNSLYEPGQKSQNVDWATILWHSSKGFTIGATEEGNLIKTLVMPAFSITQLGNATYVKLPEDLYTVISINGWIRLQDTTQYIPLNYTNSQSYVWCWVESKDDGNYLGISTTLTPALNMLVSPLLVYISTEKKS